MAIVHFMEAKKTSRHMNQMNNYLLQSEFEPPHKLGSVVRTRTRVSEITYGLVCKDGDKILYNCLEEECLPNLFQMLRKDEYKHIGFQAVSTDSMKTNYIINLFKYNLPVYINIFVYWGNCVPKKYNDNRKY